MSHGFLRHLKKRISPAPRAAPANHDTTPSPVPGQFGCDILSLGTYPIRADVVFVHGLRGHRRDTWTKNNICWPETLLPRTLPHVRIITFGYDADVIKFGNPVSQNNVHDHSLDFLSSLANKRLEPDEKDRPIIIVGHSLGGLVAKEALELSKVNENFQPHIATIFPATKGIIFLGTPHRGSDMVALAKDINNIIGTVKETNDILIRTLGKNSETLAKINENFGRMLAGRTFKVHSYVEQLSMSSVRGIGPVVGKESGWIGDPYEGRGTIRADHIGIAKFDTESDHGYQEVSGTISRMVRDLPVASVAANEQMAEKADTHSLDGHETPPQTQEDQRVLGTASRKWVARLWKDFSHTEFDENAGIADVHLDSGNATLLVSDFQSCDMVWTIAANDITYFPGRFMGTMSFPKDFPFKPPRVRFETPIFSQYVNASGGVCSVILHDGWSPAYRFRHILGDLLHLFEPPDINVSGTPSMLWRYPYNLYRDDPDVYRCVCNWFCHTLARPSEYIEAKPGELTGHWAARPALTSLKRIYGADSQEFLRAEDKLKAAGTGKGLFEVEQELAQAAWKHLRGMY